MKRVVVANWKMYVETPKEATRLIASLKRRSRSMTHTEVIVAPPVILIPEVVRACGKGGMRIGAQTLSPFSEPMHTGEVSAAMLKASGVSYVLVGHSERRAQGESEETIRAQLAAARAAGLTTILCVGEKERDLQGAHFSVIEGQLTAALPRKEPLKLLVAYEPIWAIGKSAADAMRPVDLQEMVIFIRKTLVGIVGRVAALKVPILYGGSVEGGNARALLEEGGVSGFLVGHASVKAESFAEILNACRK